jgi:transposase
MTQRDRDRLVVLKKALKKLIKQSQAAKELGVSSRQVKRLLKGLREEGDKAVIHGLRGRPSSRKRTVAEREKIIGILSQEVYRGFGPTLGSEYLKKKHKLTIGREALRQIMIGAGLWKSRKQTVQQTHQWRTRRSCRGELVQWDTSEHDWLEGRGEKLYLIHMIDDASSGLTALFVRHDSTAENMRLVWIYVQRHGRPVGYYTDKASLFVTTPKVSRDARALPRQEREPMPPTQIGRALQELGIVWIGAHSPQAKGRVERSFGTAQDRLVKGLRVAGASTLEEANRYLQEEFLPWWNQHLVVTPANAADAHRPLGKEHDLAAVLSVVDTRQVGNDYTIQLEGKLYQITEVRAGLRGAMVRVESRLDGSVAVRFREEYLKVEERHRRPKAAVVVKPKPAPRTRKKSEPSAAARASLQRLVNKPALPVWKAARIDRTRHDQWE